MLAYACVYSFYNQDTEHMDVVEQQTENLELHTNALQILLGEAWPPACSLPPPAHLPALSSPSPQWVKQHPPPSSPLCSVLFLHLLLHSLTDADISAF